MHCDSPNVIHSIPLEESKAYQMHHYPAFAKSSYPQGDVDEEMTQQEKQAIQIVSGFQECSQ